MITSEQLRRDVIEAGVLEHGELVAANGQLIGQKLEFDHVKKGSRLFRDIVAGLVDLAAVHESDVLISVPSGADEYAKSMSVEMDIPYILLNKPRDKQSPFIFQAPHINKIILRSKQRPFIVDDVYRTGSQIRRVIAIPELRGKDIAAGVIWRRDNPELVQDYQDTNSSLSVSALIHEYVPDWAEDERHKLDMRSLHD